MDPQAIVAGSVPFTLGQNWAFTTTYSRYFTELFEYSPKINPLILTKTIKYMFLRHDILRTHVIKGSDGWQQIIPYPDESIPLTWLSLTALPEQDHATALVAIATAIYKELDRYEGQLIRFVHFIRENTKPDLLLVVIHHLISDHYSNGIFWHDFIKVYNSLLAEENISLSPKPPSFKQFAEELTCYTQSHLIPEFEEYWSRLPWEKARPWPTDYPEEQILQTEDAWRSIDLSWHPEETSALLTQVSSARLSLFDVLLTALALTITQRTGTPFAHLMVMDTGRISFNSMVDLDLTRTIGFLATNRRLLLNVEDSQSPREILHSLQKQLRVVPHHGIGCDVIHSCSNNRQIKEVIDYRIGVREHVLFNFLRIRKEKSLLSSAWSPSTEFQSNALNSWESPSPLEVTEEISYVTPPRTYRALYWQVAITHNQLYFMLRFDQSIYKQTTVECIYQNFKKNLENIIS